MKDFKKILFYSIFTFAALFSSFELYSMESDGYRSGEERKAKKRAEKPGDPKYSPAKKAKTEVKVFGGLPQPHLSGFRQKLVDKDVFVVPDAPASNTQTSPVSPMGRGMNVLRQVSPLKTPDGKKTFSPGSPDSPVFKNMGPFTPMKAKRQSEHIFLKQMEEFLQNFLSYGLPSDPLVQIVKVLFELNGDNQFEIKIRLKDVDACIRGDFSFEDNRRLITLFGQIKDQDIEILKQVLIFHSLIDQKNNNLKARENARVAKGVRPEILFGSEDPFDTFGDSFSPGSLLFVDEGEKGFEESPRLVNPQECFSAIRKSPLHSPLLFGKQYDDFAYASSSDQQKNINDRFAFVLTIILQKNIHQYYLVQDVVCNCLNSNSTINEPNVLLLQNICGCILDLLNGDVKESCLLSYELKPLLITAKKINETFKFREPAELERFILIHDAHILNLVYEEKMLNPSQSHLAGGHFEDCMAINLSKLQSTSGFEISNREVLVENTVTGIKTVKYSILENDPSFGSCVLHKTATLFPLGVKPDFYNYVLNLYGNVCVEVLSVKVEPVRGNLNLTRETRLLRQNINGEDVYFVMVNFTEIEHGCQTKTIWTVFPLGVFVIDWNDGFESLLIRNENVFPIPCMNSLSVSNFKEKIYFAVQGNTGGDNDSFYSFTKDNVEYILAKVSDGVYIKFMKENFDRIYPVIEHDIKEKERQYRADKAAEALAKRKQKAAEKRLARKNTGKG